MQELIQQEKSKTLSMYYRLNCTLRNIQQGELTIFPGVITHSYEFLELEETNYLVSNFGHRNNCFQKHGEFFCPGFQLMWKCVED